LDRPGVVACPLVEEVTAGGEAPLLTMESTIASEASMSPPTAFEAATVSSTSTSGSSGWVSVSNSAAGDGADSSDTTGDALHQCTSPLFYQTTYLDRRQNLIDDVSVHGDILGFYWFRLEPSFALAISIYA